MTIYNQIWEADENACSVSSVDNDGTRNNRNTDIILNEQVRSSGRRTVDLASRPLFSFVNEKVFDKPTYKHFIALLDNYAINTREREEVTTAEKEEEARFLNACMDTNPMRTAFEYVTRHLKFELTKDEFLQEVSSMWFDIYTNFYNGNSTHFCSGFEHVFVGEGKFSPRAGASGTKGEISGFHSWIKFYLDEKYERVNYLGYKYDLGGAGPDKTCVVTLQMLWNHQSMQGDLIAELFKKKGGFFVGPSPECEIAMGTVAMFESRAGLVSGDRIPVTIDDGYFDIVLYRSVDESGNRGKHIRSFYPTYKGAVGGSAPLPDVIGNTPVNRTIVRPVNVELRNNQGLIIESAMINPLGQDLQGEWVQIKNTSTEVIDLAAYELRDKQSRPQELSGVLAAKSSLKVDITRNSHFNMQLGNNGGLITLHKGEELVAAVVYTRNQEGIPVQFDHRGRPI